MDFNFHCSITDITVDLDRGSRHGFWKWSIYGYLHAKYSIGFEGESGSHVRLQFYSVDIEIMTRFNICGAVRYDFVLNGLNWEQRYIACYTSLSTTHITYPDIINCVNSMRIYPHFTAAHSRMSIMLM